MATHLSRIIKRDGDKCHYCKCQTVRSDGNQNKNNRTPTLATKDHVVPKSMGGPGRLENFVLACKECNEKRGDNLYYCACSFCTFVIDDFMDRHFGGTLGPVKPRVWKHRGMWVASWGLNSYYSTSWERAMERVPSPERANA